MGWGVGRFGGRGGGVRVDVNKQRIEVFVEIKKKKFGEGGGGGGLVGSKFGGSG